MSSAFSFSPFFSSLTFTNSGGHPTNLVKLLEMLHFSSLCLLIHFLATSIITEGMLSLPLTSHYWETAMKAIMYSRRMKGRGARCLHSCVLEFQSALLPASNHVFACWATKHRDIITCYLCNVYSTCFPVLTIPDASHFEAAFVESWLTQLSPVWNQCCQIVYHYIPLVPQAICKFDSWLATATRIFCFHYAAVSQAEGPRSQTVTAECC